MDEPIRRSKTEVSSLSHTGSSNLPESMREFPVEEFDMTLQDAVEAGKVSTLPITETHFITPEKSKSRKGLMLSIGGGAVALATTVALAVGLNLPKNDSSEAVNVPPAPDPAATSEVEGNGNAPVVDNEAEQPSSDSIELGSNISPEKLSETTLSRISDWINAGKTPELETEWVMAFVEGKVETNTEFLEPIAEKNATEYANALFTTGWENDPDLAKWVELFKQKNISVLELWLITSSSNNPKDISPFEYSINASSSSVIEKTDTTVTTKIEFTEETNSDENRAIELNEDIATINGNAVVDTSSYVIDGNSWKISALDIQSK